MQRPLRCIKMEAPPGESRLQLCFVAPCNVWGRLRGPAETRVSRCVSGIRDGVIPSYRGPDRSGAGTLLASLNYTAKENKRYTRAACGGPLVGRRLAPPVARY